MYQVCGWKNDLLQKSMGLDDFAVATVEENDYRFLDCD